ncbi:YD repeat protein [Pseudodesulfovibrio mercurii]|uniref:YD repeat protein n=1 Tax=Pseudodesulfovibrio mercurii TaxID=641491 RepID=F0JGB1_9BACT|nr:RHS repeat-associated core domain-containing protein [Pseudodesulfovibrio mercurii]EGB15028.1 YD repeat protein [Pseudodesulfovibrio mercurii]
MAAPYMCETRRGPDGRIVEKTETVRGRKSVWAYAYDGDGRLTEAKLDGRVICQCWYDREGRRVRDYLPATAGANYRDYQYTQDNRLMRAGSGQYSHDERGFRSIWSDRGVYTLYEYSPDYRLLKAEEEGRNKALTFDHDDDGRRSAKYLNGQLVEAYRWLDFVRLAAFHDGRHGYEFAYREGERTPYAMRRDDGTVAGLLYDQVGSLRVVADVDGNVIKEVLYDPFGGIIEDTNPSLRLPIGFAGGLHDRDLGFVRFGWRDYDVRTGRWTAPDPIGDKGGDPDWYGYCLDDPVNMHDPMGLFAWIPLAGAAIGAGSNAYDNWDDWRSGKMSTGDYATSVGLGAVTGAVSTMGGGIGSTLLLGGGSAALNEVGNQYIRTGKVDDVGKVAAAAGSGVIGGAAGKIGKSVGKNFGRITPSMTIPPKPLKDASNLGSVVSSTVGTEMTDDWLNKALDKQK